jgi:hypothetical protein
MNILKSSKLFNKTKKSTIIEMSSSITNSVIFDTVIKVNQINNLKHKKKKKQVRFYQDVKPYDGLHPITNAYCSVVLDYFNGKITNEMDILNKIYLQGCMLDNVLMCVYSLFTRLQSKEKAYILPGGGCCVALLNGHIQSIYSLYGILHRAKKIRDDMIINNLSHQSMSSLFV